MEETSRAALEVIRSDDMIKWVADQLVESFSEGITQSGKEFSTLVVQEVAMEYGLSTRDKTKREKYETSRPYTEEEKLELVRFALREVFVTLPAMQRASAKALLDLGAATAAIEFAAPAEEERFENAYTRSLSG